MVQHSFLIPFGLLILVLVCRVVFRRTWLAYLMVVAVTLVPVLFAGVDRINVVVPLLGVPVILLVLARFGLFAFLVTTVFSSWGHVALTANPSSWFFGASVATMALFVAIAIYGFVVSLGGQRVFKDAI
jgi:hypothetical protein